MLLLLISLDIVGLKLTSYWSHVYFFNKLEKQNRELKAYIEVETTEL